jgi:general secretion pathway protein A
MPPVSDDATFFKFSRSPFSLTPDPKFYFRSRSHGRVFEALSTAIARRDSLMLVVGDLGVGKTTLCRTLIESPECRSRAALVGNALLTAEDLLRVMLRDLGAIPKGDDRQERLAGATLEDLMRQLDEFLRTLDESQDGALLIIDEAHSLPPATLEQVIEMANLESNRHKVLQFLLAGQPAIGGYAMLPRGSGDHLTVRARLLPLERDECERYVHHRLTVAGGAAVTFNQQAVEVIYTLSGGLPRLVNLLCERALQEAAASQTNRIEAPMVSSAASALDLMRIRPKRFRWYGHILR